METELAQPVISAENIGFAYRGSKPVLENVSFKAEAGEHISLIGPNGSGKSTLLQILSGCLPPDSGRVTLGRKPLDSFTPLERARRLSFVPQEVQTDFPFNCLELVLMALYPHRPRLAFTSEADIALAEAAMRETGVWRFAEKNITELSGGERQKVIITRAMLQIESVVSERSGGLLLLDEALSALDISARIDMMKLLSRYAESRRGTVIGIHHDLHSAYRFSSRVVALARGKIAACGSPREVFTEKFFREVFSVKADILGESGFIVRDSF